MKSEDKIEQQFDFEARQDHTVGLLGLIGFVAIGSIVLWLQGMPFGMIAVGALVLIGGAVGLGGHLLSDSLLGPVLPLHRPSFARPCQIATAPASNTPADITSEACAPAINSL